MNIIERPLKDGNIYNTPNRIVVHAMGEYILDPHPIMAVEFLEKIGLSAHYLIMPSGDIIVCRKPLEGAYHARGFNRNSIGIEYLVDSEHDYMSFLSAIKTDYVTDEQWTAGIDLVLKLRHEYKIENIDRHSDLSPGRKLDPGEGFKWEKFLSEVDL